MAQCCARNISLSLSPWSLFLFHLPRDSPPMWALPYSTPMKNKIINLIIQFHVITLTRCACELNLDCDACMSHHELYVMTPSIIHHLSHHVAFSSFAAWIFFMRWLLAFEFPSPFFVDPCGCGNWELLFLSKIPLYPRDYFKQFFFLAMLNIQTFLQIFVQTANVINDYW